MKIEGRDFTTIEQRIIKKVVLMILEDMQKAWRPVHAVKLTFVRSEVNPQFAAIVPPTDVVVVMLFEVEMDQVSGSLTVCLPYSTIEPIIGKLRAGFQSDQLEVDQAWIRRLRDRLNETSVKVDVELGTATLMSQDFITLTVGDTIQLDTDITDELLVLVEGVPKFKGYPGVVKGNKAVQISTVISRKGT
jgi:flagellar motor switch protein FliM